MQLTLICIVDHIYIQIYKSRREMWMQRFGRMRNEIRLQSTICIWNSEKVSKRTINWKSVEGFDFLKVMNWWQPQEERNLDQRKDECRVCGALGMFLGRGMIKCESTVLCQTDLHLGSSRPLVKFLTYLVSTLVPCRKSCSKGWDFHNMHAINTGCRLFFHLFGFLSMKRKWCRGT